MSSLLGLGYSCEVICLFTASSSQRASVQKVAADGPCRDGAARRLKECFVLDVEDRSPALHQQGLKIFRLRSRHCLRPKTKVGRTLGSEIAESTSGSTRSKHRLASIIQTGFGIDHLVTYPSTVN